MLACVKTDMGKVEVIDVPRPKAGPGQILVRTTMATICGTDMHFLDEFPNDVLAGLFPDAMLPQGLPMGHEGVGVVEEVGPGVARFKEGDRVVASCLVGCGRCPECLRGETQICSGGGRVLFGCQAEYFLVPNADINATKIPDEVSEEMALLASDILSTGFGALERAGLRAGDSVAIFAQGPVGLCATAAARTLGAGLIIAVESIPERMEMARRLGANVVINPKEKDPVQEVLALTQGRGVDIAVEAVGLQATFEAATNVVRRGGTVSSVGVYGLLPQVSMPTFTPTQSFLHRRIVTTLCPSGWERLDHLLALARWGKLDLSCLFTHRLRLQEAPRAYQMFRSKEGGVLKIALTP